mmetsp:Transcript_112090/g.297914  ORF Transcript_112090/g.297914 Transcript_112090/m.297914 type:complete len:203 (-) Transcript_112090:400-1008(-)
MLPMMVHGSVPKMPCTTSTQKVGMVKKLQRSLTSSINMELQVLFCRRCREVEESSRFKTITGSCKKHAKNTDTIMEAKPIMVKATLQPLTLRIVFLDRLPTSKVDTNMPTACALCTRPNIFPRRPSDVESAMTPFEIGLSAASRAPTSALRAIMCHSAVGRARPRLKTPWPKLPMAKIVLRRRMPRSARMPHNGAAMLMHTP